jgi:hypothetical protein
MQAYCAWGALSSARGEEPHLGKIVVQPKLGAMRFVNSRQLVAGRHPKKAAPRATSARPGCHVSPLGRSRTEKAA